jgi:hypothetical protein
MIRARVSCVVVMLAGAVVFATAAAAQNAPPQIAHAPAAATAVLATAQFSEDPDLRCDLLEVKRISGGALMVRWRIVNTAGQANASSTGGFTNPTPAKTIHYYFSSWDALNYIDPAENKKYLPLTDSANNRILDVFGDVTLQPGQQRLNWAKFPAPPPGSTKISISIPNFAPFEDAPVAQ